MLTGRAAAHALKGAVGSDEQARILLRAGVCGTALQAGGVVLYDERRVIEVAQRPLVDESVLAAACPCGLYLGRVARGVPLDVSLPWEDVSAQVRQRPVMPAVSGALLVARVRLGGRLPWVATLCGFVVHGADLTGFDDGPDGQDAFRLERPGTWFTQLERRWFPTGRGGRPWVLWDPMLPPVLASARG